MFACHSGRASRSARRIKRRDHAHHQRARAAHAGRARQIAGEHHVGADGAARKIPQEPSRDDLDVVAPALAGGDGCATAGSAAARRCVHRRPRPAPSSRRRAATAKPFGSRADERPPACVVRVLAEDFEAAGNPPDVIRGGARRPVEAGEDALEQRRLWRMLGRIETALDERRRERPPRHGRGTMSRQARRDVRRIRASGEIENGPARGHRAERNAALDRETDGFRQFELAADRLGHVATGIEDAFVETPAVHADRRRPGRSRRRHAPAFPRCAAGIRRR